MLLTGSLAFAQATTPPATTTDKPAGDTKSETKKGHKGKKSHKGGKKSKKGAAESSSAPAQPK
jgi:hypothetical protein